MKYKYYRTGNCLFYREGEGLFEYYNNYSKTWEYSQWLSMQDWIDNRGQVKGIVYKECSGEYFKKYLLVDKLKR
jgi:hypothetical protein